jgi:hypothetical protein
MLDRCEEVQQMLSQSRPTIACKRSRSRVVAKNSDLATSSG